MTDSYRSQNVLPGPEEEPTRRHGGNPSPGVVWSGSLHILWEVDETIVNCNAIHCRVPILAQGMNARAWPPKLLLDTSQLRDTTTMFGQMTDRTAQWYAKFMPVDHLGVRMQHQTFQHLVAAMVERGLGFEVECKNCFDAQGSLFIWGLDRGDTNELAGVFRPTSEILASRSAGLFTRGLMPDDDAFDYAGGSGALMMPAQADVGAGVWTGELQVRIPEKTADVTCIAFQSPAAQRVGILDTSNWPAVLSCAELNACRESNLLQAMHAENLQWVVRLSAAAPENSKSHGDLEEIATLMHAGRIVFEIGCGMYKGENMILSLLGIFHPRHRYCIVGSFKFGKKSSEEKVKIENSLEIT